MKLSILLEGAREKAAEDFLAKIVKDSPFHGKIYIAGGYVRDELLGIDSKDIDLVVELPEGGIKFAEWITKHLNIYRQGSLHDISKLILDLYFDQIREANYDLTQIKPYHFPIYSSYLSIFFHFSENEFFYLIY